MATWIDSAQLHYQPTKKDSEDQMELHYAKVVWFNSSKGYGVAGLLSNGTTIGINRQSGRLFYRGGDSPSLRLEGRRLPTDPKEGDDICLIQGGRSRSGNPCAELWSMAEDFDAAYTEIKERAFRLHFVEENWNGLMTEAARNRELDRLRCNPNFRHMEQSYYLDNPKGEAKIRFTGNLEKLKVWLTPRFGPPPVIESGKVIDGHQHFRWFEREMSEGRWEKCNNPLTIELPPMPTPSWSFDEVQHYVRSAFIRRAPNWMVGFGFQWWINEVEFARGNCERIFVAGDNIHAGTWFEGAEAEFLWEQADRSALGPQTTIPNANPYAASRRGYRKAAHDLAALGRSSSEWEELNQCLDDDRIILNSGKPTLNTGKKLG